MFTATSDQMFQYCPPMAPLPIIDRKLSRPNIEVAPNCPRCASANTKFCYYNNYSLSQPRYFCKGCRRYWTKGGSLRNVPVGGGCRKSRRSKSAAKVAQSQDRSSMNSGQNLSAFDGGRSNDHQKNNMIDSIATNGSSDIDLADVFAKFLNQNSTMEPGFVNQELFPDDQANNGLVDESGTVIESLQEFPHQVSIVPEKQQQQQQEDQESEKIQELLIENDMNGLELQGLLIDHNHEVVQDVLWPESESDPVTTTTTTIPNFSWQLPADDDDQLMIRNSSTNLVGDSAWSSFDLSGFEMFSRF